MLIEDNSSKSKAIIKHLTSKGVSDSNIIKAKNMTDFSANLNQDIGLFIIDLQLPSVDHGIACQNGKAIIETIKKSDKNDSLLLAISSYPNEFSGVREYFESNGCILADYSKTEIWKSALDHLLIQLNKNINFDFLIFCALNEERNPYVTLLNGKAVNSGGVDRYDVEISGKKGSIILLPKMGLVNAAVIVGLSIERFKPKIIGMSGICGGFENRAKLGQLFVSSMAYEYQSGKWSTIGFSQEPYQVNTDHDTLTKLSGLVNISGLIQELERGYTGTKRPSEFIQPEIGIFTSGSAVIADEKYLKEIESIHRKVNGLDMEIFAIHRAAELSIYKPICICAKVVVDLCNNKKDDSLHNYGSFISAQFVIKALSEIVTT
ncbi:hypothetical protein ACIKP9_02635 [Methylobacillus methanolivorans]|uniref:Nucleoside phosphorylase domain-containing protein n=1 Tax=Methylobacillus methanolivorans TaxID=1848927 RepID=A0ABW8GIV2_9PROT